MAARSTTLIPAAQRDSFAAAFARGAPRTSARIGGSGRGGSGATWQPTEPSNYEKVQRKFRPLAEGSEARVAESDAVAQRVAPRADDPAVVGGHHRNVGDAIVAQGLCRLDQPREVEVGARRSEGTYVRSGWRVRTRAD